MSRRTPRRGHPFARAFAAACFALAGFWWMAPSDAASASVSLVSDTGSALFSTADPLGEGETVSRCLVVSASGANPDEKVLIGATGVSGALASSLTVSVAVGSGGGGGSCTGFSGSSVYTGSLTDLASLTSSSTGVATGWEPAVTSSRTFRIRVTVADGAPQGKTAAGTFTWRLQASATATTPPIPHPTTTTRPTSTTTRPTSTTTTTTRPTSTTTTTTAPTTAPTTAATTEASTATADPAATTAPVTEPATTLSTTPGSTATIPTPPSTSTRSIPEPSLTRTTVPGGSGSSGGAGGSGGASGSGDTGGPGVSDLVLAAEGIRQAVGQSVQSTVSELLGQVLDAPTALAAGRTVAGVVTSPQYPFLAVSIAFLFLMLQNRLDRMDPKLAHASQDGRESLRGFPDLFPPSGATS